MMSKAQQLLISKILVKNYTLIILTKNSSAYAELNHKNVKEDIKFRLKMYAEKVPQSPFAGVNEVKILSEGYFDKTPLKKENLNLSVNLDGGEDLDADSEFIELSDGEFKNFFEDEKLFEKFEAIRKAILKNNEKNE